MADIPYNAKGRELVDAAAAALTAWPWQTIDTLPNDDDLMVLAYVPDGRMMMWRASMLYRNGKGPTPNHLQFPATHWCVPIPPEG